MGVTRFSALNRVLEFLFIDGRQDGEANHAKNGEMKSGSIPDYVKWSQKQFIEQIKAKHTV